jgi:DNA transposition AAA+ family ATPase
MSSTRYANNDDPGHAPWRNLSSPRLRPINVSLSIASQAARIYPEAARHACLWLANVAANSQRIQLCWQRRKLPDPLGTIGRITEVDVATRLGLEPIDVYRFLSGHDEADIERCTAAIQKYRAEFESAFPPLVKTQDTATIAEAFYSASEDHNIATLEGKWRHGKTEECERIWLKNLHRAIWVHCPSNSDEVTFISAIASALGISTGGGKKTSQLRGQVKRSLAIGLIDTIIIDEAQGVWPQDLVTAKPIRLDFVRELRDSLGIGSVLIVTDQFALALELAVQNNTRYAPGQVAGRRDQYKLRDAHTDAEVRAIAKLHSGSVILRNSHSHPHGLQFASGDCASPGFHSAIRNPRSAFHHAASLMNRMPMAPHIFTNPSSRAWASLRSSVSQDSYAYASSTSPAAK